MERCDMMERWRTDGEGRESGLMKTWTCDCFVHGEQKTGWWFRPIAPSDHVAAHFFCEQCGGFQVGSRGQGARLP